MTSEPTVPVASGKQKPKAKWRKRLLLGLLSLCALVLLVLLVLPAVVTSGIVVRQGLAVAEKSVPLTITTERLKFGWFHDLQLRNLVVRDAASGELLIELDSLQAPLSLTDLLTGGIPETLELDIAGLRFHHLVSADGSTNLDALLQSLNSQPAAEEPKPKTPAEPFAIPVERITFRASNWSLIHENAATGQEFRLNLNQQQLDFLRSAGTLDYTMQGDARSGDLTVPWSVAVGLQRIVDAEGFPTPLTSALTFEFREGLGDQPDVQLIADAGKRSGLFNATVDLVKIQQLLLPFLPTPEPLLQKGALRFFLEVEERAPNILSIHADLKQEPLELFTDKFPAPKEALFQIPAHDWITRGEVDLAGGKAGNLESRLQGDWLQLEARMGGVAMGAMYPELTTGTLMVSVPVGHLLQRAQEAVELPNLELDGLVLQVALNDLQLAEGVFQAQQKLHLTTDGGNAWRAIQGYKLPRTNLQLNQQAFWNVELATQELRVESLEVAHELFLLEAPEAVWNQSTQHGSATLGFEIDTPQLLDVMESLTGTTGFCVEEPIVASAFWKGTLEEHQLELLAQTPAISAPVNGVSIPEGQHRVEFVGNPLQTAQGLLQHAFGPSSLELLVTAQKLTEVEAVAEGVIYPFDFTDLPEPLMAYASVMPTDLNFLLGSAIDTGTLEGYVASNLTIQGPSTLVYPVETAVQAEGIFTAPFDALRLQGTAQANQLAAAEWAVDTNPEQTSIVGYAASLQSALELGRALLPEQLPESLVTLGPDSWVLGGVESQLVMTEIPSANGVGDVQITADDVAAPDYAVQLLQTAVGMDFRFDSSQSKPAQLGTLNATVGEIYAQVWQVVNLQATADLSGVLEQHVPSASVQFEGLNDLAQSISVLPGTTAEMKNLRFTGPVELESAKFQIADQLSAQVGNVFYENETIAYEALLQIDSLEFLNPSLSPFELMLAAASGKVETSYRGLIPTTAQRLMSAEAFSWKSELILSDLIHPTVYAEGLNLRAEALLSPESLSWSTSANLNQLRAEQALPVEGFELQHKGSLTPEGRLTWEPTVLLVDNLGVDVLSEGELSVPSLMAADFPASLPAEVMELLRPLDMQTSSTIALQLEALNDDFVPMRLAGDTVVVLQASLNENEGLFLTPAIQANSVGVSLPELVKLENLRGAWTLPYEIGFEQPLPVLRPDSQGLFTVESLRIEAGPKPVTVGGILIRAQGLNNGFTGRVTIGDLLQGSASLTGEYIPRSTSPGFRGELHVVGLNMQALNDPNSSSRQLVNLLGSYELPIRALVRNPLDALRVEVFTYDLEPDALRRLLVAVVESLQLSQVNNALALLRLSPPVSAVARLSYGLLTMCSEVRVTAGPTVPLSIIQNQPISEVGALYSGELLANFYTQIKLLQAALQAQTLEEVINVFAPTETTDVVDPSV
ncbi:MAG: hypothetical protein SFY68_05440 [Candidatus Sumerlaeia bacterium]|nr:hypothetical protein [Candidatus Sumerlaeia bacterium]